MRVVLPFNLVGQKLVKGRDFPKSVADGSKDSVVIKVGGIPDGCIAKGYFKLSWESNTIYDLTFNGDELVVYEYIVTLPTHANNKYIDYKFSFSLAIWEGDVERLTTNPVEIVVEKSNYSGETTNTPNLPESQYGALAKNLATVTELANDLNDDVANHGRRITELEKGGGLPETTTEDNDKVLTVVDGKPQWALHAGISKKNKVVFADDGEGNVSIVLVDGEQEDGELNVRVDAIETTLYGAATPSPDPTVETVTVTNLITNPHFDNGLDGWANTYNKCTREVVDGELYLHDFSGAANLQQAIATDTSDIGHRYYLFSRIKAEGQPDTLSMKLIASGITLSNTENTAPVIGDWSYIAYATTLESKSGGSTKMEFMVNFTSSSHYVGTTVRMDDIVAIDLTAAFGAGNEPTIDAMNRWMQEQYPNGFDGTVDLALTSEDDTEEDENVGGLVGQVAALEKRVESLATGSTTQTGTVYPVLHDYYIANIEEARPTYYNAQEAGSLTFTMLSDIHLYDSGSYPTISSYENIAKNVETSSVWAKLVNNDFVMLGGDLIVDKHDKPKALSLIDNVLELAEKHARCPVYAVKGNHDTNEGESGVDIPENRLTDKDFYNHANARGEKYGMVVDPAHPFNSYYYVDFPKQKIRMVCLNTSENNPNYDILTATKGQFRYIGVFSPNQMAWIKDTALRVDEGWAVMMVSHIPPFQADNFYDRGTDNPALRALCEAFAAGTGDFAEQGAREFIGHFSGHAHIDAYNEVGGLNYVLVNCTTPQKRWDISLDRNTEDTYLSLNSFIIDRATYTVKCIKIGAKPGDDYGGSWVDSFTWEGVTTE